MSNSKRPHAPKEEKRGAQEIQLSHLDNRFSCQIDGTVIQNVKGNDDIEEPDEAIYTYIFPYFHIPDTIEAAHSYICFKVNMTDRSNVNDWYENFTLTVWVIVNQALMKMKGHGGATRVDYLSGLVEKELHGSTIFGIKQLKITSNIEDNMDLHHRVRIMTFKTQDLDDLVGCG